MVKFSKVLSPYPPYIPPPPWEHPMIPDFLPIPWKQFLWKVDGVLEIVTFNFWHNVPYIWSLEWIYSTNSERWIWFTVFLIIYSYFRIIRTGTLLASSLLKISFFLFSPLVLYIFYSVWTLLFESVEMHPYKWMVWFFFGLATLWGHLNWRFYMVHGPSIYYGLRGGYRTRMKVIYTVPAIGGPGWKRHHKRSVKLSFAGKLRKSMWYWFNRPRPIFGRMAIFLLKFFRETNLHYSIGTFQVVLLILVGFTFYTAVLSSCYVASFFEAFIIQADRFFLLNWWWRIRSPRRFLRWFTWGSTRWGAYGPWRWGRHVVPVHLKKMMSFDMVRGIAPFWRAEVVDEWHGSGVMKGTRYHPKYRWKWFRGWQRFSDYYNPRIRMGKVRIFMGWLKYPPWFQVDGFRPVYPTSLDNYNHPRISQYSLVRSFNFILFPLLASQVFALKRSYRNFYFQRGRLTGKYAIDRFRWAVRYEHITKVNWVSFVVLSIHAVLVLALYPFDWFYRF